jgi:Ca2+-binding EF-hand superfamily protein
MATQSGQIQKSALAASQLDWKVLQQHHYEQWRRLVHNTFEGLDKDKDGLLKQSDLTKVRA